MPSLTILLRFAVTGVAALLCGIARAQQNPQRSDPVVHVVDVTIRDVRQLARLARLDVDFAACRLPEAGARQAEIIATDSDLQRLRQAGFRYTVRIQDWHQHHAQQLARHALPAEDTLTPAVGKGSMGGHYTLAEIEAHLDAFAKAYPKLCSKKVSIGKSIQNRDIWMVKISDNVDSDEKEPKVLYDALHHAREPLSATTTLLFMDELLSGYGTDPEATHIINERQLYFVPCVNPDGYEYNRSTNPNGGGMWRKNRRQNDSSTWGVDLNRNYATGFAAPNGGNSTSPSSNTYRGTKAFSEPETAAMDALAKLHSFVQVNSCHTYQDVLLAPWGYQTGWPTNRSDYETLGRYLTIENGIANGPASALLYIAAGTALDHHHASYGSVAWTPELGTAAEGGFWPVGQKIIDIARRNQRMFRKIALTAGVNPVIADLVVTEVGGNQNGTIEAGESGSITVTVHNLGLLAMGKPATLLLTSTSNAVTLVNGSAGIAALARLQSGSNSATPLRFSIPKSAPDQFVALRVSLLSEGVTQVRDLRLPLMPLQLVADDDMEKDRGFARGTTDTATSGGWERAAPQMTTNSGTTIQPGNQTTPAGSLCQVTGAAAGSSAGANDVDGGYTDLLSPTFDLSHLGIARVSFQLWYAESVGDDAFDVSMSSDGGRNWTSLYATAKSTSTWTRVTLDLPGAPSKTTQFRFRATDANASLVEALIDDFQIHGPAAPGDVLLSSSGVAGTTLRAAFRGRAGGTIRPLVSAKLGTPLTIAGIDGQLWLDPQTTLILAPLTVGANGYVSLDVTLPNIANSIFHVQALHGDASGARFGNLQSVRGR